MDCLGLAEDLSRIVASYTRECDCMLLSGGVDTSFIAASLEDPGSVTAITVDLGGSDAGYATIVARKLGITQVVVKPSRARFREAVARVVGMFKTIDPVEVAADAVHLISMDTGRRLGCRCITTGDGGDELFLGYSFLFDKTPGELRRWIDSMAERAWLPTLEVAGLLGLRAIAPLYAWKARELARRAPLECLIGERMGVKYGKYMMRLLLEERGLEEVAWRGKEPVTSGSGSLRLLESIANRGGEERFVRVLGFKPPSRLHLYLGGILIESGQRIPSYCHRRDRSCPVCRRCLDSRGYCRFCGTIVTGSGAYMHYSPKDEV